MQHQGQQQDHQQGQQDLQQNMQAAQTATGTSQKMTTGQVWRYVGVGTILLVLAFFVVAFLAPTPIGGVGSAAAVIAIVTASAVAIERVIEVFWTFMGGLKNTSWPLKGMDDQQLDTFVTNLNATLQPFYDRVEATTQAVAQAGQETAAKMEGARAQVDDIRDFVENQLRPLAQGAPQNQRAQTLVSSLSGMIDKFDKAYPELQGASLVANQAISTVADFVGSFQDNPARRLISIYIGALLGLAVALFFGLDVFRAAAESTQSGSWQWGIAFTGLLMGLGSNPTHEVIKLVQEVKKSRKAANLEL
jgi:hypothetical protein